MLFLKVQISFEYMLLPMEMNHFADSNELKKSLKVGEFVNNFIDTCRKHVSNEILIDSNSIDVSNVRLIRLNNDFISHMKLH